MAQLPANPVKLETAISVDPTALQAMCVEFARSIECEAQDALVIGFDGSLPESERWITVPEVTGRRVDLDKMWALVDESFGSGSFDSVCVPVEYTEPAVTLDSLMVDKQLIASFSSKMSRDENRITNIRLACQSINGTVLQPGEEFSFNDVVGPRTAERGYKEAGVIVGGDRLDNGLGGGICQVSGTLFNAVVMSDLEIVTRYTHSYELSYLTPVSYTHLDVYKRQAYPTGFGRSIRSPRQAADGAGPVGGRPREGCLEAPDQANGPLCWSRIRPR